MEAEPFAGMPMPLKVEAPGADPVQTREWRKIAGPMTVLLRDAMREVLKGWREDLDPRWRGIVSDAELGFDRIESGRLCRTRLDWLDATLRGLAGRPAFLAMHHPPGPIGLPILDRIALRDEGALAELIARSPEVTIRHIFCGHVHRFAHGTWRGIPFSAQRSLIHQFAASLASRDDRLTGSHEQPAYSIALIDSLSISIHIHEFLDKSPRFELADAASRSAREPRG